MDEPTKGIDRNRSRSPELNADRNRPATYLKVADREANLPGTPKRKLSVFYRSFDVIERIDEETGRETLDFRRTSSSPSVRIERPQEDTGPRNDENHDQQTESYKRGFVHSCCTLIESGKFSSGTSLDLFAEDPPRSNESTPPRATSHRLSPTVVRPKLLPQVRVDTITDNYPAVTDTSSIDKYCPLNNNGCHRYKDTDERAANDSRQIGPPAELTVRSFADEKISGDETRKVTATVDRGIPDATNNFHRGNSPNDTRPADPRCSSLSPDLVKIKDTEYPRSFVNASSAARLEKYTSVRSVDGEMSSHEESSNGSDSEDEDDTIEGNLRVRTTTRTDARIVRSKSNSPSPSFSSFTDGEPQRKSDHQKMIEFCSNREKRQKMFVVRRSKSEGDYERQCPVERHCRCIKESVNEQEQFPPFPSFNDTRLEALGLSTSEDIDSVYRETMSESELERKYIAFSIGLSADRITLKRRMALYLRQRDLAEQDFMHQIQKVQRSIKYLCSLCMDQESIDKVEKISRRLDAIARSGHRISSVAESLGAVHQEQRISRAIFLSDKYQQILRSRCENLTAEIAETKQILLRNNIVIEENSGEIGDDLPKIRYRNGLPSNRTMIARRRASIATISRPLTSQDSIKDAPRQRNSISGRVTLRRPSLCSETQRWENERINRTDSANSVVELRDIFEHTESRRNSIEENNNLLRSDQCTSRVNYPTTNNVEEKNRLITKKHSFLESNMTKVVEKQLISCIRTAEPFRLTRNIETWRPILWLLFVFFLGFYAKQITSTFVT